MIKVVDPIKNKVCSNNIVEFQIPKSNKTAGAEKIYVNFFFIFNTNKF